MKPQAVSLRILRNRGQQAAKLLLCILAVLCVLYKDLFRSRTAKGGQTTEVQPVQVPPESNQPQVQNLASPTKQPQETQPVRSNQSTMPPETVDQTSPVAPGEQPPPTPSAPQRWPVPSAETIQEAERLVNEVLGADISRAKTPAERLALADRLLNLARETDDDPAACYVLCQVAQVLAFSAMDFGRAVAAVDLLGEKFQVDVLRLKAQSAEKLLDTIRPGKTDLAVALNIVEFALVQAHQAAIEGREEILVRVTEAVTEATKRLKDAAIRREIEDFLNKCQSLAREAQDVKLAQKRLLAAQTDQAACATVGRWYCLVLGDWQNGLPLLARGNDPQLSPLAIDDMARPSNSQQCNALAERWWQYAAKAPSHYRAHALLRAEYWYLNAMSDLSREQRKLWEARQLQFVMARLATKPFLFGTVVPGNVALASRGTLVGADSQAAALIDGVIPKLITDRGIASARWPCTWTITFPTVYRLREIRLKLPDPDVGYENYVLSTSPDGKHFVPLADHSKIPSSGWQRFVFLSTPVKAIQLKGLYNSRDRTFYATELEAYCSAPLCPEDSLGPKPATITVGQPAVGPAQKSD